MNHLFEEFDDERRWLGPPPRRRRWLLRGLSLVAALSLASLVVGGRSDVPAPPPRIPTGPSAEQQALEAGRRALVAWGRFAVTNHLGNLRGWFWPNGPQYRQLAREARLRRGTKALGPPAYRFTLTRVRVLAPSPRHRILRGRVRVTRPGERGQSYGWDVWMRRGGSSGDRWRLWSVNATRGPRARSAADPVVVAAGDIAEVGGHQRLTSDRVLELDPDRVLVLGDNQYWSGTLAEYRNLYGPTWGRFKARTRPVPGNHEYETPRAAGYFAYFAKLARPKGRSYYSFDLGGWHLIALNSSLDHGPGSAQERWLRADLVATAKRCILAYWHFPRLTSIPSGITPLIGDFDGDHRSDVFMYGPGSLPDHVWLGRPDRAFRGAAARVGRSYLPLVGDFNGNGHADIFWYGPGSRPDVLWYGKTDGRSPAPRSP